MSSPDGPQEPQGTASRSEIEVAEISTVEPPETGRWWSRRLLRIGIVLVLVGAIGCAVALVVPRSSTDAGPGSSTNAVPGSTTEPSSYGGPHDEEYVDVIYRALLGRDPSPGEATDGVAALATGPRGAFVESVVGTTEFKTSFVSDLNLHYWADFRPGSTTFDRLVADLVDSGDFAAAEGTILSSQSYFDDAGGTDLSWVEQLYRDTVMRPPSPEETATMVADVAIRSRDEVVSDHLVSASFVMARINGVDGMDGCPMPLEGQELPRHAGIHCAVLGRQATSAELPALESMLTTSGSMDVLVHLYASEEFYDALAESTGAAGSPHTSVERPDRRTISTIYADEPFTCGMEKFFPPGSDLYQRGPMQAVHAAPAETERALEIASNEKDLGQVLLPGKFRIGWSTVWFGNFGEGLGVDLTVEFDEPVQLSAQRGLPVIDDEQEGRVLTRADGLPQLEPVDDVGEEFSKARSARLLIDMDASLVYVVIPSFVNSFCEWPE